MSEREWKEMGLTAVEEPEEIPTRSTVLSLAEKCPFCLNTSSEMGVDEPFVEFGGEIMCPECSEHERNEKAYNDHLQKESLKHQ